MAKSFFIPGTPITSTFLNAINNPRFTNDVETDGDLPKIVDEALSDEPDQLKTVAYSFIDHFSVTAVNGFQLTLQLAKRMLANSTYSAAGSAVVTLPPSTSGEVWLNWLTGSIQVSNIPANQNIRPASCYPLLSYVTSSVGITSYVELFKRARYQDLPSSRMLSLFGGRSLQNAVWNANSTVGNLTLAAGRYGYNDLTINIPDNNFGVILNGNSLIQVAGNLVINGHTGASGFSFIRQNPTAFGSGAVFSNEAQTFINYNAVPGSLPIRQPAVPWSVDSQGHPGSSSSGLVAGAGAVGGEGGDGGGRLHFQVAGSIIINGRVRFEANGGNGATHDRNYGTIAPTNVLFLVAGGSGGSGGLILLQCGTQITHNGVTLYQARGGNGGAGTAFVTGSKYPGGVLALGGTGGGGGWAVEECPVVNGTASVDLAAGIKGSDLGFYVNSTAAIGAGGAGSGFGGGGGFHFLSTLQTPQPGDIELPYPGSNYWHRPATAGQYERNLRFPIVF